MCPFMNCPKPGMKSETKAGTPCFVYPFYSYFLFVKITSAYGTLQELS